MCLVAVAWKIHPRWRLLMAGNRDEFHGRPTVGLAAWSDPAGIQAGRDLQSGGTWVGIAPRGRVAVVTNVRDPLAQTVSGPSRGELPVGFLSAATDAARHARDLMAGAREYSPFNLLIADADTCEYIGNHPALEHRTIAPGIHGMSNGGFDIPWPKTQRLCEAMRKWSQTEAIDPQPLWRALADERIAADAQLPDTGVGLDLERKLSPAFIRDPVYGTRASTIIAIDYQGRGYISERRFGPDGVFEGETTLFNNAYQQRVGATQVAMKAKREIFATHVAPTNKAITNEDTSPL
jgi:uncharacterized protein with NRDE domain